MSMKVALEHRTTYTFAEPVTVHPHVVRLRPAPHSRTPVEAYSLEVKPPGHFLNWQQDPFGNWMARLVFPEKVAELDITVGLVADMVVVNPFDFFIEEYAERFPFAYPPELAADLAPYLRPVDEEPGEGGEGTGPGPLVRAWVGALPPPPPDGEPTVPWLSGLNAAVHRDVAYSVRLETGVQTPDETLRRGIGSCRDSAWLLVSVLRQLGLAARFVSGYLVQLAADPDAMLGLDGPTGPPADFTDLHAWAELYLPGAGWVGLDPTSALFAGEGHIPLAATPHPTSAAPIEGATDPVEVRLAFGNEVRRVHEDPRVTRPYTREAWSRIDDLGRAVDERLDAAGVRLTMGGEPTFVAREGAAATEWSTAADGEEKRRLATRLAERLRDLAAKGGLVHRGQGKWYPGEALPRWQIALQWRTDGEPLWSRPDLLVDPWRTAEPQADPRARAEALARELVRRLGLPAAQLLPAYEDPLAALVAEVARPAGPPPDPDGPAGRVDPADAASVAALDRAVTDPVAWVLPLQTDEGTDETWTSPAWRFRRGRLVLVPGDSPAGLRLPLASVAWQDPEAPGEPSYLEVAAPLVDDVPPVRVVAPDKRSTTALVVEARDGLVHVFLPPAAALEDYVALVRLLDGAADALDQPVVVEGYGPPPDARLAQLVVTPDPGVIEVNLPPSRTWDELRDLTATLYRTARECGLATEKFELDGLHTGTGGGNHLTLGGARPVDSPLLRRPDLLVSLVTYWQRHPSLSYLFSGRFVGPTSQAPRFDEARPEAAYEMEIAAAEVARLAAEQRDKGLAPRPWLVDRALRHLLTDLTGNTHRAELCLDKLYSPDSSRGRLGLLEMRGFEMPPHHEMALVQALLVRSLVAMLWEEPVSGPLVRWGTALHEDFLLPEGARRDAAEVLADLRASGIDVEDSWLDPFLEFRFPRIGLAQVALPGGGHAELGLRQAIEPWHVLGEETSLGGTARYVDSSLERLQVTARGIDPHRHLVTCQSVPVPLAPTGAPGELYAGVRYKAWQPWSALHPSIGVHSPLHFDVVDIASQTSLGGATYHVVHPGGRSYDHPPVNAQEAEARRATRFEPRGHTAGALDVAAMVERGRRAASEEYAHTLDLRRVPLPGPGR